MITEDRILFIDNHLLILAKMPGELVQGDRTGDSCLEEEVKAYLKEKFNKPGEVYLGVVHRIDRPVGGIVVFARTSKAAARLSKAIQERTWQKIYLAITQTWKGPQEGVLIHHLRKDARSNKSFVCAADAHGAKEARLRYSVLASLDHYSLLAVALETGRHHQIRAQLAAMGAPIKGDLKYGAKRSNPDGGINLWAWQLNIQHPVAKVPLVISCPPPSNWPSAVIKTLDSKDTIHALDQLMG